MWISVKDKLPTKEGPYLVFAESLDKDKPLIHIAWFAGGWSVIPVAWADSISHWMPLPKPPKNRSFSHSHAGRESDEKG